MNADGSLSRRDFIASGAALGAAGLAGMPVLARAARPEASDALRVGLIGAGGRGTGAAIQALKADPSSVLWAVGEAFEDRIDPSLGHIRQAMAQLDGEQGTDRWSRKVRVEPARRFVGFDAFQRVIDSGVDVVLLATPPAFRPQHLAAAVEARKHVFCEKPVAVDGPGVRRVLESAERARRRGLSIMSGFCWRYHDQVREAFGRLRAGGIGALHTIQTTYNTTGWVQPKPRRGGWSDTEFQLRNWHYFHPISGDHVVEQAVHAIDWIAWAMDDEPPERCWAVGGRATRPDTPETGNVFDHFSATYEYPGGVRAYHMCRHWPNTPSDNSGYFLGSEGRLAMGPWSGTHVVEGKRPWRGSAEGNDMYQRELDVLFGSIRGGEPVNDGVPMARSTLLALMARMAAYTGQTITWDQAMRSREELNPAGWSFGPRPTPELAVPGKTAFS